MKIHPLCFIAVAAIVAGCAEEPAEYSQPLTSPGAEFSTVPPAVQNSVRAQAGAAEIVSVTRHESAGETVYLFTFKNPELRPPLLVATDGSVLRSDLTVAVGATEDSITASTGSGAGGIKLDDLPSNVVYTIHNRAPTGEVDSVRRITRGSDTFYDVTFKDPAHHPRLFITSDGTVLK